MKQLGGFVVLTDIEIAQSAKMLHIGDIAKKLDIQDEHLEYYGKYKAKINDEIWDTLSDKKNGKLVLVT
ncbi:MAG: formate--tetrahydrofolate ligase, partial [Oscillospiraceae bacterium]